MAASRSRPGLKRFAFLGICAGLVAATAASDAFAGERFKTRPYLKVGLGRNFYLNSSDSGPVELQNPSGQPIANFLIGADLSKYWGLEFGFDYVKTDILQAGGGKLGDFSTASGFVQARVRYPLMNDLLVPYALLGAGYGIGDFSGRKNFTYPIGGRGWSGYGIFGGGIDYFIYRNIALNLELKDQFSYRPELTIAGSKQAINADAIAFTGGLRVYFDKPGTKAPGGFDEIVPPARDSDKFRTYVNVRAGKALYTSPNAPKSSGLALNSASGPLIAGGFGANFSRYWGSELAFEYARAQVTSPTLGKVSGYPVWTILGLVRMRYPLADGKFVPYAVFGGGAGMSEEGDDDIPQTQSGFNGSRQTTLVGAFGGGFDYFVQDNVALTFEIRDTFNFDTDVTLNAMPVTLDLGYVSFTGGLRIFFN